MPYLLAVCLFPGNRSQMFAHHGVFI